MTAADLIAQLRSQGMTVTITPRARWWRRLHHIEGDDPCACVEWRGRARLFTTQEATGREIARELARYRRAVQ